MPAGTRGSVMARFALPLAILLLALLPSVVELVASGRTGGGARIYATNPFATLFALRAPAPWESLGTRSTKALPTRRGSSPASGSS